MLDYFDAFQIGLTATPSVHTLGYFQQNLVAQYPYERSVIDGVNVPFEVFRIRTEIGERGSRVPSGFTVPKRDRHTRRQRYEELTDDLIYAPTDLDRSVIAPNQIRTVLETFRDTLPTELFPDRTEVPKTLIFAKDDNHAEEIVHIAREVFGKGNEFAKKITYKATGASPEELIAAFRNQYNPRLAVTVDMIATGTDIKPVEVLIFMRDVKSALYFEQMKGRGVRTVNTADLINVTPDARGKDRFILIDAVGVSESAKTISPPLEQRPTVSFDRLLEHIASGRSDPEVVSSLAVRLAALARKLPPEDHALIVEKSGSRTLTDIAAALMDSLDNDRIAEAAEREHGAPVTDARFDATAGRLRGEALRPLSDNPGLRKLLIDLKKQSEVAVDIFSPDAVISTGFDEKAARELTVRFETFLNENQDQLTALTILYAKPQAKKRLTYESLEQLRAALARPPWLLEPIGVWSAYKRLSKGAIKSDPARVLTDMDTLAPLSADMAGRFNLWLGREARAGREYSPAQLSWLEAIRDHLAANIDLSLRDLQDQPAFSGRGGVVAARAAFGTRLPELIEDLTEALVA